MALGITLLAMNTLPMAHALPVGENITHGQADITHHRNEVVVKQHTDKLIMYWTLFDIGSDSGVRFEQPDKNSVALNKVTASSPSLIRGRLDANGQIFLINPTGILFGTDAQVNVGGLVASTHGIQDADFLRGQYTFTGTGHGAVENFGTITSHEGGGIALLASYVNNKGVLRADMGTIALGAGDAFTLTFDGNRLLNMQIDRATADALIESGNLVISKGGKVLIKADAENATISTVVNAAGVIEVRSLHSVNGRITLASTAGGINIAAASGAVREQPRSLIDGITGQNQGVIAASTEPGSIESH